MQAKSLNRIQATFGFLRNFKANFCSSVQPKMDDAPKEKKQYEGILYNQHSKHVSEIVLNQPKILNSLDLKMIKNLLKRVRHWVPEDIHQNSETEESDLEKNVSVPKVVLMTGAGEKAFCAGGDIKALYNAKIKNENIKILKDFFRYEYLLDYSLTKMKPIQVALWNGIVMGGGVGLSQNAPIRVATDNTVWAMPETSIGLFPDVGATYFLPRICNNDARIGLYLGLTGDKIKGKDLAICGVATHYVPRQNFENLKKDIIESVNEDTNLEKLKEIVKSHAEVTYSEDKFTFPNIDEIHRIFAVDTMQDLHKRLQNVFENGSDTEKLWAKNVMGVLSKASQISQAVVLEQIKRGINFTSIEEAYNLEAQLVASFIENSDFFEGVRALLIEKDNKPCWKFTSHKEINNDYIIKKYFERSEQIEVDPNTEN